MQLQSIIGLLRPLYVALFYRSQLHFIVISGGDVRQKIALRCALVSRIVAVDKIYLYRDISLHACPFGSRLQQKCAKQSIQLLIHCILSVTSILFRTNPKARLAFCYM